MDQYYDDQLERHIAEAEALEDIDEALNNARGLSIKPAYLNEYELNKRYGGPEEGGWWYDTGRFIRLIGIYSSENHARDIKEDLKGYLAYQREGRYPPSSMLCDGWPDLLIEDHPGEDFPKEPQQYE